MVFAVIFLTIFGIYYFLNTEKDYISNERILKDPNRDRFFSSLMDDIVDLIFSWPWYIQVPLWISLFWYSGYKIIYCYIFFGWTQGVCN